MRASGKAAAKGQRLPAELRPAQAALRPTAATSCRPSRRALGPWLAAAAGALAATLLQPAPAAAARPAEHVVLVSIDGLRPEYVIPGGAPGTQLPHLTALRESGSWADGLIGVYPTLTYPSHTSLVTGAWPLRHGITSNTLFEPLAGSPQWQFESERIRVPTLWSAARGAGLTTAGVSWPVSVGAAMDWLIPEVHQAPTGTTWLALSRRESTPGLVDAVVAELGGFGESENRDPRRRDDFDTTAAAHILRTHRPNLLLLHLVQTDYAQHANGPGSPEAREAFERVDAHIGELLAAAEAAGIRERTAFVVAGDHGFHRIHSELRPNVVLRQAGLLKAGPDGRVVEWKAIAHRAAIRLADPADAETAARVRALFEELADGRYRGLLRLVEREELQAREADAEALLYLEPVEGYAVSEALTGEEFLAPSASRGSHGFLPELEAMHTGLLLSGAGVRRGVTAPLARMVDVAPTVARLLGFELAEAEGVPMVGLLETGGH